MMPAKISIPLTGLASDQDFENLENLMAYASPEIASHTVDRANCLIEIELREGAEVTALESRLTAMIRKIRPIKAGPANQVVIDRLGQSVPCRENLLETLEKRREVIFHAPGVCSLHGQLHQMHKALDRRLLALALDQGAMEATYPVSIALGTLKRSNFFSHYPQFANFISVLNPDAESISLAAKNLGGSGDLDFLQHLQSPTMMCRSAGCLHAYPSYENEVFAPDRAHSITMDGRMFRNEGRNLHGLERLHEYSMREIIFLGSPAYVREGLAACMEWCKSYLTEFGLQGVIQSAGDPFFADNLAALQFFQRSEQSKHEFRLINPFNGNSVSVASVNNHGEHFAKSYNIKFEDGTYVATGCFGVGFERLLFLTLSQYGYDSAGWPQALREFYFPQQAIVGV